MMKAFIFLMLLTACSVHCNATWACNKEEDCHTYLDEAIDIISKAKYNDPNCKDYKKFHLKKALDCKDLLDFGYNKSGVYIIWPMNRIFEDKPVYVYCDMDTDGGGWTVIQRRGDFKTAIDYFYRNWGNYKQGFGDIKEDFWLGNDKIYAITNQKHYSVRFDLKDVEQEKRYAVYDEFWIDEEERQYTLHISEYNGNAGDSMKYHNNQKFFTFDQDNVHKCAKNFKGAWWYDNCKQSNLNGIYYKGESKENDGLTWYHWKGYYESLEWTEIKIRPKHF